MRIAVVAVLACLVSTAHAEEWKKLDSPGGFSISFPGEWKESTQSSGGIKLMQYTLQSADSMFMATWNDGPPTTTATPAEILDNMRDGTVKRSGATLIAEKKLTMNGHPGRELTLGSESEPKMIAVARLYLVGKKRLYMAMVVNEKKAGAMTRKKFLDSFKITGAKASKK